MSSGMGDEVEDALIGHFRQTLIIAGQMAEMVHRRAAAARDRQAQRTERQAHLVGNQTEGLRQEANWWANASQDERWWRDERTSPGTMLRAYVVLAAADEPHHRAAMANIEDQVQQRWGMDMATLRGRPDHRDYAAGAEGEARRAQRWYAEHRPGVLAEYGAAVADNAGADRGALDAQLVTFYRQDSEAVRRGDESGLTSPAQRQMGWSAEGRVQQSVAEAAAYRQATLAEIGVANDPDRAQEGSRALSERYETAHATWRGIEPGDVTQAATAGESPKDLADRWALAQLWRNEDPVAARVADESYQVMTTNGMKPPALDPLSKMDVEFIRQAIDRSAPAGQEKSGPAFTGPDQGPAQPQQPRTPRTADQAPAGGSETDPQAPKEHRAPGSAAPAPGAGPRTFTASADSQWKAAEQRHGSEAAQAWRTNQQAQGKPAGDAVKPGAGPTNKASTAMNRNRGNERGR